VGFLLQFGIITVRTFAAGSHDFFAFLGGGFPRALDLDSAAQQTGVCAKILFGNPSRGTLK
jgi:hypothetical protein